MAVFEPIYVTKNIYLNGYITEVEGAILAQMGISHVLNLDLPYDSFQIDMSKLDLTIMEILVYDMAPMSSKIAQRIIATLYRILVIEEGCVYVHCNAGVSRSPTAVWLYLVLCGVSEKEATNIVSSSATHLAAPEMILTKDLNICELIEWSKQPRWELRCQRGFTKTLDQIFDSENSAISVMNKLKAKNEAIASKHFRIEKVSQV